MGLETADPFPVTQRKDLSHVSNHQIFHLVGVKSVVVGEALNSRSNNIPFTPALVCYPVVVNLDSELHRLSLLFCLEALGSSSSTSSSPPKQPQLQQWRKQTMRLCLSPDDDTKPQSWTTSSQDQIVPSYHSASSEHRLILTVDREEVDRLRKRFMKLDKVQHH